MPRMRRVVIEGLPHHVTQRGNYKQSIFNDRYDYNRYLNLMKKCSAEYGIKVLAYCLMPNHVHFIVVPEKSDSLSRVFNVINMCYAQYFNKKTETIGHLWQGRFYSCVMSPAHLLMAVRYVERNPVRAGLVKDARDWPWSSAKAHLNMEKRRFNEDEIYWLLQIKQTQWKEYLLEDEEESQINEIRMNTVSGKPVGTREFVHQVNKRINGGQNLGSTPRKRELTPNK